MITYKVFFDGSLKNNVPRYGFVLCDQDHQVLHKMGGLATDCPADSMAAEYYAMIVALTFCRSFIKDLKDVRLIVYGDAKGIINHCLKVKHKGWEDSNLEPFLNYFTRLEFNWIPRGYNCSHREAKC